MDVIDYLNKYHDKSFKEMSFNEVDALVMAMISYVDFNELGVDKKKIKGVDLLKYLDAYVPSRNDSVRKLKYIKVLSLVCKSKRYDKVIFFDFKKVREAGFEFVFIRIAYRGYGQKGTLKVDEMQEVNLKKAPISSAFFLPCSSSTSSSKYKSFLFPNKAYMG